MSYRLIDVVEQLGHPRLLVIGDLILDRYIWGDAERVSQEAPVILLREDQQETRLGGAANVANMLRGLDAHVTMAGVVGADPDGEEVRATLRANGVDCSALIPDPSRPTTVKQRFIGRAQHRHPHQMLRVDREVRELLDENIQDEVLAAILQQMESFDAILISDYGKGVCHPQLLAKVIAAAKQHNIPVIADPPSTGNCSNYIGATAVTPNRLETSRAVGFEIDCVDAAFQAGDKLCQQFELEYAFVTLDSDGIALTLADGTHELLPTRRREVYDITGAGDMVLAMIGVGAAAGVSPADLARLANIAGGLEVEQIGVVTISRNEMIGDMLGNGRTVGDKISSLEEATRHIAARKRLGQKIVMTNGCFDVLHTGHITYLQQAAEEGDCLVVAINSDASVRGLDKAPDRPIFGQQHRATMLAAMEGIDYVVIFDEETPCNIIQKLQPDLLVKGGTYTPDQIVGKDLVEAYGGSVKALAIVPGLSTTDVLQHIRNDNRTGPINVPATSTPRKKAG